MPELLNAVTTTKTVTTYDRSYGGSFDNPYEGAPQLTFHMHRVTLDDATGALMAAESLPNVIEPFASGKVYQLKNPQTGDAIPGQTITAEMVYAVIYSVMCQALAEAAAPPATP
jgi:hypothetical protein